LKQSIIYTVLGFLLVLSAVLFSSLIEPGYWQTKGFDSAYRVISNANPGANTAMRNWLLFYTGLGLVVLAAGIAFFFLKTGISKTRLALIQTVLGGLVIVSLIVFVFWVEPDWLPYTKLSDHTGNLIVMSHDTAWVAGQIIWKVAVILLGLGVMVSGIVVHRSMTGKFPVVSGNNI
jgi:hypothetical protein